MSPVALPSDSFAAFDFYGWIGLPSLYIAGLLFLIRTLAIIKITNEEGWLIKLLGLPENIIPRCEIHQSFFPFVH